MEPIRPISTIGCCWPETTLLANTIFCTSTNCMCDERVEATKADVEFDLKKATLLMRETGDKFSLIWKIDFTEGM